MKKIVSILLAVLTMVSIMTVSSSAAGLILSIPASVSSHNLEAYGLHTMNVYSTEIAPSIDGYVGQNEYPGPNNGCSLSAGLGDNLWMSAHSEGGTGYGAYYDINGLTADEDVPAYVKSYLTYDNDYLYFAVSTVIKGYEGSALTSWFIETRSAFSQNENIAASSSSNSIAWIRYTMNTNPDSTVLRGVNPYPTTYARQVALRNGSSFTTLSYSAQDAYVDEGGNKWDATTYAKASNSAYKITVLDDGRWAVVVEGRQPLGDILRVTDVEYADGSPLDYVPEWGAWGVAMQLVSSANKTSILPNGEEYSLVKDETIFAQTMLPALGLAYTGGNSRIGDMTFVNTISDAVNTGHGKTCNYLMNPVHFLGTYDPNYNYDAEFSQDPGSIQYTSRVTRPRNTILTSGLRGVNNRVVGGATSAAGATGDDLTLTVVLAAVMLVLAAACVVLVVMRKRSRNRGQ